MIIDQWAENLDVVRYLGVFYDDLCDQGTIKDDKWSIDAEIFQFFS